MKNSFLLSCCIAVLAFSAGCHKGSSSGSTTRTPVTIGTAMQEWPINAGPTILLDSFPLAVGHVWHYMQRKQTLTKISSAIVDSTIYSQIDTAYFTIKTFSDTLIHGVRFTKMGDSVTRGGGSSFMAPFIDNGCGLGVGYYTAGTGGLHFLPYLHRTDSAFITDSTFFILQMPAVNGQSWSEYFSMPSNQHWAGFSQVVLPNGTYNCMYASSFSGQLHFMSTCTRYFSDKGLVLSFNTNSSDANPPWSYSSSTTTCIISLVDVNF